MDIKELRNITGLSCNAFGELYKIPRHTLNNWEQGIRKPPVYVLELLERAVLEDFSDTNTSHRIRFAVIEGKKDSIRTKPQQIVVYGSRKEAITAADLKWSTMSYDAEASILIGIVEIDADGNLKTGEVLSVIKEYEAE